MQYSLFPFVQIRESVSCSETWESCSRWLYQRCRTILDFTSDDFSLEDLIVNVARGVELRVLQSQKIDTYNAIHQSWNVFTTGNGCNQRNLGLIIMLDDFLLLGDVNEDDDWSGEEEEHTNPSAGGKVTVTSGLSKSPDSVPKKSWEQESEIVDEDIDIESLL